MDVTTHFHCCLLRLNGSADDVLRQTRDSSSEEREQQPPKAVDDEDDPFVHALGQQQPLKRQKLNGMGTPLVLNSDDADNAAVPRSSGRIALAAGCDQIDMTVLGSKAQRVADTQRRLREQLQQLKQLEQQEESDEPGEHSHQHRLRAVGACG